MKKSRNILRRALLILSLLSCALTAACGSGSVPGAGSATSVPTGMLADVPNTGPKGLPLYDPQGLCFDLQGNLYVADRNSDAEHYRVLALSPAGHVLSEWHAFQRTYNPNSNGPTGIACDHHGNIYVADTSQNRILWISPAGRVLAQWGSQGSAPGHFDGFTNIALDTQGNVFVSEYTNHRIEKFSPTGTLLTSLTKPYGDGPDQLAAPIDLGIGAQGDIYVVDQLNNRMVHLSSTGAFLGMWGQQGSNPGQFNSPGGMVIDAHGTIYVADDNNHRIETFSPTGTVLAVWGASGKDSVHFDQGPGPLALDPQGNIVTTDTTPGSNTWHIITLTPSGKRLVTGGV